MCSGTLLGFGSLFHCPTGCNFIVQCVSICSSYVRFDASVQVVFFIVSPEHILLYNCSAMSTSSSSGASAAPKAKGKAKGRNQSPAMLALKMQKRGRRKELERSTFWHAQGLLFDVECMCIRDFLVNDIERFDCQHSSVMFADFWIIINHRITKGEWLLTLLSGTTKAQAFDAEGIHYGLV